MENSHIRNFPKEVKLLISVFVIVLSIGVTIGLIYVGYNTDYTATGTQNYYAGDPVSPEFQIPEQYPKSLEGLLLTTHTHVMSFAIIFFVLGRISCSNLLFEGIGTGSDPINKESKSS